MKDNYERIYSVVTDETELSCFWQSESAEFCIQEILSIYSNE